MSTKTITTLICDIDETEAAETVRFALDGVSYEIDLTAGWAETLRSHLALFVEHGRPVAKGSAAAASAPGGARKSRSGTRTQGDAAKVRAWAQANGLDVPQRGRISAEIRAAYEAAQSGAQA